MRNGHICIRNLFVKKNLKKLRNEVLSIFEKNKLEAYRHKVRVTFNKSELDVESLSIQECEDTLSEIDKEDIPFLQLFNVWKKSKKLASVALSSSLGKVAADLLGVPAVRLYQDALFIKRVGDGQTQWHSDLNQSPFDGNDFITCWIPLQDIPAPEDGGSGLLFATASHRDFALPFWSDPRECDCGDRYNIDAHGAINIGDATFHHGWCLHTANANDLSETRYAYSVSYVADNIKVLDKEGHVRYPNDEDYQSYRLWIDGMWGEFVHEDEHLPLVFVNESYVEDDYSDEDVEE